MSSPGPVGSGQRFSNGFGTSDGRVVYYLVVALDWLSEEHSSIQPLADPARVAWVLRVLGKLYPDRTYETVKKLAPEGVTIEQMAVFETPLIEELGRLELAHKYSGFTQD